MPRSHAKPPVKMSLLGLLERGSRRYSDLVNELKRPDKTVYIALRELASLKLVFKNEGGEWVAVDANEQALRIWRALASSGQ